MLTLTRSEGESLYLDNIYDADGNRIPPIIIKHVDKNKIGIAADKSVKIFRSELFDKIRTQQINQQYRQGLYLTEDD